MMPMPSLSASSSSSATSGDVKSGPQTWNMGATINRGMNINWTYVAIGGGALLVLFLLMRKFK